MMLHSISIVFIAFAVFLPTLKAEDQWSFLVLADWHGAESFAVYPGSNSDIYSSHLQTIRHIKRTYGNDEFDLVVLPGDSNTGKWDEQEFNDKLDSSLLPQEAILQAGRNCYGTMKDLFSEGGFGTMLMALGDHEIGGNRWVGGSMKVDSLPIFRQGFIEKFNLDQDGNFLFDGKIGEESSRPLGTVFENTSFAMKHKNALFVTVDAFEQIDSPFIDRSDGVGGEGVVTCTVRGHHLTWFENVLKEARKDDTIKHIFVQAHLPIVQPVRKVVCSGQFIDYGEDSEFWRIMNQYGVDVYLAGEVHANTATKSNDSNLVQIVSRGNMFNNFIKVEVNDDVINIKSYNEIGDARKWNNNYELQGQLTIDKMSSSTSISSSGSLELLQRDVELVHLSFEEMVPLKDRQVLGMVHDQISEKMIGDSITMRNIKCHDSIPNHGVFGQQFDAQAANLALVGGRVGNYAGLFNETSRLSLYGTGPNGAGNIISFSMWIRTTTVDAEMILVHYGAVFGPPNKTQKDFLTLTLDRGKPALYSQIERKLITHDDLNLADNMWHHIAVSMPRKSCLLADIEMYVDGTRITTKAPSDDLNIFVTTSGRLSIGSFGYSSTGYEDAFPQMKNYIGLMDDFKIWARPLKMEGADAKLVEKKFEISDGVKCTRKGQKIRVIRAQVKRCKKTCMKDSACLGFEWKRLPEGKGKPKCFLLAEKPTVGRARSRTKCALLV